MNNLGLEMYSNINAKNLHTLLSFIKDWVNSLNKTSKAEFKIKAINTLTDNSKITPDDISRYTQSQRSSVVEKILRSDKSVILAFMCASTHTMIRNFIVFYLALTTGHRTGCITNMTVPEFKAGRNFVRQGDHIVLVYNHKTVKTHGPARVVISKQLYAYMDTYLNFCRPASESDALLLNWGRYQ